jgi:hypothetical protein
MENAPTCRDAVFDGCWRDEAGGILKLEKMERVEGIEPSTKAWEAFVLPLNYTRFGAADFVPEWHADLKR